VNFSNVALGLIACLQDVLLPLGILVGVAGLFILFVCALLPDVQYIYHQIRDERKLAEACRRENAQAKHWGPPHANR